jgi:hypothetical protein
VNLRQHVALQSLCFLAVLEGFALSFYANARWSPDEKHEPSMKLMFHVYHVAAGN